MNRLETGYEADEKFDANRAIQEEQTFLERIKERGFKIAEVLALVSTLAIGVHMQMPEESHEQNRSDRIERVLSEVQRHVADRERPLQYLDKLYNIDVDVAGDVSKETRQAMKIRAAKEMIQNFALGEKFLASGDDRNIHLSQDDVGQFAHKLNEATGRFADRKFGNKDGKSSPEEVQEFQKQLATNAGMQALVEMNGAYGSQ